MQTCGHGVAAVLLLVGAGCGPAPDPPPAEAGAGATDAPERGAPLVAPAPPEEPPPPPQATDGESGDPEEPGEGPRAVTFGDLSLVGEDVNGLLDLMFEPEKAAETTWTFPEGVRALDGEQLSIVGYMIPLDWDEERVTGFMLVRDLAACCFGGMPRPDEWVDVRMEEGEGSDFFPYVPIRVTGVFSVGLDRQEDALVGSVFQMRARSVEKR